MESKVTAARYSDDSGLTGKKVEVPLFNFIFVQLAEADRNLVLIRRVVRYLFWLGKPAVRDEEIKVIKSG
jgi:hypothetical protein